MAFRKADFPKGVAQYLVIHIMAVCLVLIALLFSSPYIRALITAISLMISFYCWGRLYILGWPPTVNQFLKLEKEVSPTEKATRKIFSVSCLRWMFWDNLWGVHLFGWLSVVLVFFIFEIIEIF